MYPEPRLLEGELEERVHSLLNKFTKEVKSSDYFKIIDIAGNNILDYSLDTISWMNPIINKSEVYIRKDSIYKHLFHVEHKDDNELIYFENTDSFRSNYYKYLYCP